MTWGISAGRANAPFTAAIKNTFEQKLPDGNSIHTVRTSREARDSAGRTMTEMAQGCERGEDGQMHERLSINVNDPVARVNMNWVVGGNEQLKVVQVFHQPDPQKRQPPSAEELARQQKMMQAARGAAGGAAEGIQERRPGREADSGNYSAGVAFNADDSGWRRRE